MSRDALQESLSAVMDNEADELELRRVLNAFDDAETRDTWSRYQVARAVMHKDLLIPRLDIAAAVSAALADEAVPAKVARGPWRSLGRLAVAASVTVAVLAGYKESAETPGPMANGVLQGQSGWQDQRLPGYLRQHAQESAVKGTESALPYARAANLENR